MNNKGAIICGLVVFLAILAFPIWYSLAAAEGVSAPELVLPAGSTQCVEGKDYMAAHHMDLLDNWRNAVVRDGKMTYTSKEFGTQHEMSLTRTCLNCHGARADFCDRCHDYANVEPRCWDCHVDPKGN